MNNFSFFINRISTQATKTVFVLLIFAVQILAQPPRIVLPEDTSSANVSADDNTWWYVLLALLFIGLAGAIFWVRKTKAAEKENQKSKNPKTAAKKTQSSGAPDFDKEIEWMRKNKNLSSGKKPGGAINLPRTGEVLGRKSSAKSASVAESKPVEPGMMPIFSIDKWQSARPFEQLPLSSDDSLMSAIEQIQDEFEEDETVRELAVRVLAAFQTMNSVESLSQVALYDLSSTLRSQAVGILSGFNHESVFEAILLSCADPTREVRAAGARGLFQLSFDRADAWTRIAESGDEFRMRQSARAAIEAGLVERYFDRLVHQDSKYAYEAFTFLALLLRSGETEQITAALVGHPNMNVRRAILHVIKIVDEPNGASSLYDLADDAGIPADLRQEINQILETKSLMATS